ncbi:MAG: aromatic ring-hydroxylating dioxygenase subunit alpha [Proteobacteria bacterium]|nr:aromatic ring-hydroxylating dioxygenase subunit alpha [Pseudomonadota bacterium]
MIDGLTHYPVEEVRDDYVPKEPYFAKDFEALEAEKLWPFVWQIACRLEEIPEVGDYVTYDIVDDSVVVVRTAEDEIKAYHNVCPHRGRRLADGCGTVRQFVCPFHGWRYGLDGQNIKVIDKGDWGGCLDKEDIRLSDVKCDQWGGFVFINMDPDAESLIEFLAPMAEYCKKFEFEKLRYRWYKTVVMQANWKTVLGFFNEFYHVQQAHPQLLEFTNDYSKSGEFGRHAQMWFEADGAMPFSRSPRLPPRPEPPMKEHIVAFAEHYNAELRAMVTERNYAAAMRVRDEVSAETPPLETLAKWGEFHMEAAAADGSGWPVELTPGDIERSGLDWHVFPNTIFLHGLVDGVLWYRMRPNGRDPESCIFDVWSLVRYAPGKEPPLEKEFYADWRDGDWGMILEQDFENISEVQKGYHSRGFKGERTNPVQERAISNFHRVLRRFLHDPYDKPPVTRER